VDVGGGVGVVEGGAVQIQDDATTRCRLGNGRDHDVIKRLPGEVVQGDPPGGEGVGRQGRGRGRAPVDEGGVGVARDYDPDVGVTDAGREQPRHLVDDPVVSAIQDVPVQPRPCPALAAGDEEDAVLAVRTVQPDAPVLDLVDVHVDREVAENVRQPRVGGRVVA